MAAKRNNRLHDAAPEDINRTRSEESVIRMRNIVVIGASAGGVDALKRIVSDLPADLAAALFVVLHVGPTSYLPEILDRAGPLPVHKATNGAAYKVGNIYVAPPGFHLLLHDDHMMLRRGPRENLARPAIDPLFRSAALSFGARVIGVLLSGALSDGTAGLRAVKAVGGVSVIQHPKDATVPDMVNSALRYVEIDHCVPAAELGSLLGAVLDINLAGERSFPIAELLATRGVPFLFLSGYDSASIIPDKFSRAPQLSKPVNSEALTRAVVGFRNS